ncbi:thiamin pyrophosphokinase 1 isoform X2 [Pectinophora gossypiella]|uniref:thiamin pyrophosphokinase 1 isoform X2 n=1 Tax=Pectinophora gossypiella TaxID=13191 RepID=UPI00214F310F|nr:thiamin pyrophosphokinase 1 isoform X2 [Pectinophora gossypiella]
MAVNGFIINSVKTLSTLLYMQPSACSPCTSSRYSNWDVQHVTSIRKRSQHNYAILVLNRPLTQCQTFMANFWNNALVRVTVDGGTKQWDLYLNKLPVDMQNKMKLPDLITGDFDSIPEDIFEKYRKKGCEIVHTPDQNYTDFTKALMELQTYCLEHKLQADQVVAIGQSSGRLDQVLGNIQTLFLNKEKQLLGPKTRLYLMSDDAISWLLQPGEHNIAIPEESRKHKKAWCSLVPVGETCRSVTTSGLKWNLSNHQLKFGEIVSTSNTFDGSEIVTVKCSHTLLWSMKTPSIAGSAYLTTKPYILLYA